MTRKQIIFLGILLMIIPIFLVAVFDTIGISLTDNGEAIRILTMIVVLVFMFSGVILVCLAYYFFRKKANKVLKESLDNRQEQFFKYREAKIKKQ